MEIVKEIPRLAPRVADSHKGDFGKVCIIAGSFGMSGAAAIAGRSALRAGAGLVRIACPRSIVPVIAAIEPCYTAIPLPQDSQGRISADAVNIVLKAAGENDVLAFGPGVGVTTHVRSILESLIAVPQLRMLIDADGLNNLCKITNWPEISKARLILTPHPGEMKRLWAGLFRENLPEDRCLQAEKLAIRTNAAVVLKGANTVVTDGQKIYVNTTGNPGMATAGCGDCLTGVITALAGQGLCDFDAAVLGTYIHGLAGDIAAEKRGQISLIATDIVDELPAAFMKHQYFFERGI